MVATRASVHRDANTSGEERAGVSEGGQRIDGSTLEADNECRRSGALFLEHYHMPGEERGWWHGRLVERLGLGHEVARKDFAAIVRNEVPGQPGRCLTQRQNASRRELVWEKDTETKLWTQVERDVP